METSFGKEAFQQRFSHRVPQPPAGARSLRSCLGETQFESADVYTSVFNATSADSNYLKDIKHNLNRSHRRHAYSFRSEKKKWLQVRYMNLYGLS
jgi:hypothetical protein